MANRLPARKKKCTGHKTDGVTPCSNWAMDGMDVCYKHGGATPKGIASPHFKTGRWSKYMPAPLQESYERARNDKDNLQFNDDIALIDAMILANLPKLETRESGAAWSMIKKIIGDLTLAFADEQYGKCVALMDVMTDIVNEQMLYYATEQEVKSSLEQRRKLVESEQKRRINMQQFVESEDAMSIVTALLQSVKDNVSDVTTLNAIQSTFTRLTVGLRRQRIDTASDNG